MPAGTSFVKAFFRLAGCSGTDAASCPVLRIIDYSSEAAVQSALAAWPHYFVATFARNVLRRAVSQYQVGGRPGLPGDLSQGAPQAEAARAWRACRVWCLPGAMPVRCLTCRLGPHRGPHAHPVPQYLTSLMDPECPALSWGQYCEDPYTLGDLCGMRR